MFKHRLNHADKTKLVFAFVLIYLSLLSAEAYAQPLGGPESANSFKNCASSTPQPGDANKRCTSTPTNTATSTFTPTPTQTPSPTPTNVYSIVFTRPQPLLDGSVDTDVWIMNPDGSNQIQLTTWNGEDHQPDISPDGSKVVYYSRRNNLGTLWVMNRDGTNPIQLPVNDASQSPDWSPDSSQIAFANISQDWWEIWIANADGSNPQRLTTHAGASVFPAWSPDGTKLVYVNEPSARYYDLFTVNANGTGQSLLVSANGTGFSNHKPAWSPDGTQIATIHWTAGSWSGPYSLWLMNADGSNGHVLVQNLDEPITNSLAWSGDGNWLVFGKGSQIWRVRPDGTGLTQITTNSGWEPDTNTYTFSNPTPTPTPTRTRTNTPAPPTNTPTLGTQHIVFTRPQSPSDGSVDTDVWIMNPDGSNQTQLTNFIGEDRQPAISPNGSKIAYYSRRNGLLTLWVMNSDGTNPIQFSMGADTQTAAWSPDSSKIAFANNTVDWWEIWTSNPDGSNPQRLTTHPGASVYPNWSPSGNKLVYVNEPSARYYDLYTVNTDGTGQSLLLSASGTGFSNHGPSWSPDGTQIATIHFPAGSWTGPYDLWLMDANGSNGHVLVQGIGEPLDNNLSWSGDGNWILFSKNGQIWRVHPDGIGLTQITTTGGWEPDTNAQTFSEPTPTPTQTATATPTPLPTLTQTPSPTPTNVSAIVFALPLPSGDGSVDTDIWIMDPDGANPLQLTTWSGEDRHPSLSPNGSQVVYYSRRAEQQLWIINRDGSNPVQIPLNSHNQEPSWSPDGNKIAFANVSQDGWEIWTVNADGTNPQRLTTHAGASVSPAWSPDSSKLVYTNEPFARFFDLYTVNANGTGQSLLVSASGTGFSNHQPAWSPDGSQIATIHWPAGSWSGPYDLWLMNADGSNGHVIVSGIEDHTVNDLSWSKDGNWIVFTKGGQIGRVHPDGTRLTQVTTTGGWEPDTNAETFSNPTPTAIPSPTPTRTNTPVPTSTPSPTPT